MIGISENLFMVGKLGVPSRTVHVKRKKKSHLGDEVCRLLPLLEPLPHPPEEVLQVFGVALDVEEGRLHPALPHLGPHAAKAGKVRHRKRF